MTRPFAVLLLLALAQSAASAQSLPVLDAERTRLILQEVSGDAAYEHIRHNTQFHRPRGGADGLWQVAEYYAAKAREFGLANVQLIKQVYSGRPWNARFADLWIVGESPERIASTLSSPLQLADFSRRADVTAELIDIGGGTARELEGKDVRGRIVLTYGAAGAVMRDVVIGQGAAGIVWYPSPFAEGSGTDAGGFNMPDQIRWVSLPEGAINGGEPTFAFVLSLRQGVELRNRLARATQPIRVRALVDAGFDSRQGSEPWQVMVEAFIPGTTPDAGQDVVLTGHMQEEATSANDDASGTASTLEVARALNRLISDGRIPRPRRNLRFWWVTEYSSQRQYFADNPEAHQRMWVNVNQDMVGANQALDIMRKQGITRLPASRFHFYNDVVESVIEFMVRSNTFELAQAQAGITSLYPNAHLARLGSRHRYNAEVIPFHLNTDHHPFLEAPIGVPAVTFTNMPDRYIHSSDDDLFAIDRTQLGRNAASVALIAYTMAAADDRAAPVLAAELASRGGQRLARNVGLGMQWIAAEADKPAAYHRAAAQVRYAAARERQAIASLAQVGTGGAPLVPPLLQALAQREAQAMRDLETAYRMAANAAPPAPARSPVETQLAAMRPALVAGPREFLTRRGQIANAPGLGSLMAFEVLNYVDGRRTGLEIYELVAAQAREAGAHYFGEVTAEAVQKYLENAAQAEVVRLR